MTKYLFAIILLLLLLCSALTKCNRNQSAALATSQQTVAALTDSIRVMKDRKTGQVSLQKTVFTQRLDKQHVRLTPAQKQLFKTVDRKTVAAAVVTSSIQVRDVVNTTPTLRTDSTQVFRSASDSLRYTITVKPGTLSIDTLDIPNTTIISFTEDRKKMVVNVTNTNPYLKTQDIQGYVLPKKKIGLLAKIINAIF